jgi:hypothetical protein
VLRTVEKDPSLAISSRNPSGGHLVVVGKSHKRGVLRSWTNASGAGEVSMGGSNLNGSHPGDSGNMKSHAARSPKTPIAPKANRMILLIMVSLLQVRNLMGGAGFRGCGEVRDEMSKDAVKALVPITRM